MNKPKKILVVDDSSMIRKIIRKELEDGCYDVIEAKDGLEAINKATVSSPPDLITLDVKMPNLNGFETCCKLAEEQYAHFFTNFKDGKIPIIFVTANDTMEDRRQGFKLGAADFVTKPFEKGELLTAVNKILNPSKKSQKLIALVVDDTALVRKIVSESLAREGLDVIEAEDGIQAFEIIKKQKLKIDILVTDMMMPRMNGVELTEKIRNELNLKDLPVIFLTAMDDQSSLLKIFKAGATDHIIKPFAKEELIARVNVHLEKGQLNKRLRKMVKELHAALEEVKTLCGMIPICASCKKIRDDKGYWNQIELYIRDHSEAEFTHGICPECAKKLYPGYY